MVVAPMRVGLNQSCLPGISTAEFVDIAADCGADAVELRVLGARESPLAMGIAARAGGLPVVSVGPLMDWALPDDPDPTERLEALLETASAAACSVIICVGPISERPLPLTPEIIAVASEHLAALVERAWGSGARLALEQVGRSSSRPQAVSGLRTLRDALAVVDAVGAGTALCVDSYNLATADVDYNELASLPADKIAIAQIADRDPSSPWRALPGDGDLDLSLFVGALAASGYSGALSVETFPQMSWSDARAAAGHAIAATRQVLGH
jgi:4-hydroxyphenylpyruvate dioxygenase